MRLLTEEIGMKKYSTMLGITILFALLLSLGGCSDQNNDDTNLSPARDVTGTWSGIPVFTDRANDCRYDGTMEMTLQQEDSHVSGYFDLTVTKTDGDSSCVDIGSTFRYLVEGTISSSHIELLVADTDTLNGSFTTDLMTLRWEQCHDCDSGPAVKLIGMVPLMREH